MTSTQAADVVSNINHAVMEELSKEYPDISLDMSKPLPVALSRIYNETRNRFVIIIDEWDVLIRDEVQKSVQEEYINFLRALFKGTEPARYVLLAYMTGILPIKKIRTQSALNNFDEFTMLEPGDFAPYFGFTESEVRNLCERYGRDYKMVHSWYDGYALEDVAVYNPQAVVRVMQSGKYRSYWSETGTFESIVPFINMNYAGLKDDIIKMLSGANVPVNTRLFQNDIEGISNKDDVLTYLIHLGYLGYDQKTFTAYIPNEEIRQELMLAVESGKWDELIAFNLESVTTKRQKSTAVSLNNMAPTRTDSDRQSKVPKIMSKITEF